MIALMRRRRGFRFRQQEQRGLPQAARRTGNEAGNAPLEAGRRRNSGVGSTRRKPGGQAPEGGGKVVRKDAILQAEFRRRFGSGTARWAGKVRFRTRSPA